jgi:hypothetical protein
MNEPIAIGRLLRSSTTGCVVGCRVTQLSAPEFGGLLRIPLGGQDDQVYGLIYDIHIDDDGIVRQLVTAESVDAAVILDNRLNRNVPVEISVLFVGFRQGGRVFHLLPPRPPLSLDAIYPCSDADMVQFTGSGRFGYFRHVLHTEDIPVGELLAAHLRQAGQAQTAAGHPGWAKEATQELIVLLRDDYPTLMSVLSALADAGLGENAPAGGVQ